MNYNGIITPMITPVKNNKIDFQALEKLINYLMKIDVQGLFPASSTGAFTLFSFDEHKKIIDFSRTHLIDEKIFLPGISRNNIEETIKIGKFAIEIGASGVVIITPYYLKFGQREIYNYYSKIAESLDIPIFVYNNPDLSGNNIEPETLNRLFDEYSNILGIKDSSSDMRKFNAFLNILPKGKYIFQGRDDLLYESLILGAAGGVCGTSNFSPLIEELYKKMDFNIHKRIVKIISILRKFQNHVSYNYIFRKKVLNELNPKNYAMHPFKDVSKEENKILDSIITELKEYE